MMIAETEKLRKEIENLKRLNKTLGVAFEQILSCRKFNAEAAIAIIGRQEHVGMQIVQLRQSLELLTTSNVQTFTVDESSLDSLLSQLNITRSFNPN